jgi:hypothetical protein
LQLTNQARSQILRSAELRNLEEHVITSARSTARGILVLALVALLAACQSVPKSGPEPPDLSRCDLAHSYVLGETFDYPGAIEIWECQRNTVVTLTQFLGRWPDRIRQLRTHLVTEAGPDEQVVGCRKDASYFSGIVAVTSHDDALRPTVVRAWKADLNNWAFEKTAPASVVCNHE